MRRSLHVNLAGAFSLTILLAATPGAESPVADAAMKGDRTLVRSLIQQGANVNAPQGDGMTALHWAASHGDAEIAQLLLDAKADVKPVTRIGGYTPLHVASRSGRAAVLKLLLAAGADAKAPTSTGVTPLHLAAMAGNPEAVLLLLDRGAEVNAREPAWGQTPLMLAAAQNRVETVALLMKRGADPSTTAKLVDLIELSASDAAARRARDAAMDAFQKQAPKAEAWRPTPSQVQAAVQASRAAESRPAGAAVAQPEPEAAPAVGGNGDEVSGFPAMVGVHGGLTALLLAVREGHARVVETLLDAGADINQTRPGDNTSPLLLATINGHFDLAMYLLGRGANPNLASEAGATPLYAVINKEWAPTSRHPQPTYNQQQKTNYLELMGALLKAGADPNARLKRSLWYTTYDRDNLRVDFGGATPFWRAAYGTDVPAMKLLLAAGADPNIPTIKGPERARRFGGEGGGGGGGQGRQDASGLPPVPAGGPGVPPIIAAAGVGYGRGYAANDHRHAPDAWLSTMKFLVEEVGANVNARDHEGFTPLHYAAARGDNALILYLVEKGADVKAVTRNGMTTADMANGPVQRISPYLETVALLEKLGSKNSNRCVSC